MHKELYMALPWKFYRKVEITNLDDMRVYTFVNYRKNWRSRFDHKTVATGPAFQRLVDSLVTAGFGCTLVKELDS